jgi:hypothetical protein
MATIRRSAAVLLAAFAIHSTAATAFDGVVEKKVFTLASYETVDHATLENVRVGYESMKAAARYRAQGGSADVAVIEGDGGHLDGVLNVARQGEAIRAFLAK